jgi:membrane protease YdiL (CAAX protease family)
VAEGTDQTSPKTCPNCGAPVVAWSRFCTVCGYSLPETQELAPDPGLTAPRDEVPWRAWEAIIVWVVATFIGAIVSFLGSLALAGDGLVAFTLIVVEGSLAACVIAWVRMRHGAGVRSLGLRIDDIGHDASLGVAAGLAGLALQFVLLPLVLFVARQIQGHPVTTPQQIAFTHPSTAVLLFTGFGVVILAPFAEELFFRGFLYQGVRRRLGVAWGAVISAAIFGLAHIYPLLWVPIGVLGYVLAKVFERRRSLLANMIGHGLFNAVGYTVIVLNHFKK